MVCDGILQLELQAIGRAVRLGQTREVRVHALYLNGTVDAMHNKKHQIKSKEAILITGDSGLDPLYQDKMLDFFSEYE
jgi:SNF2 family DNA or RNA helicase